MCIWCLLSPSEAYFKETAVSTNPCQFRGSGISRQVGQALHTTEPTCLPCTSNTLPCWTESLAVPHAEHLFATLSHNT